MAAPVNDIPPAIQGEVWIGQPIVATTGEWSGSPTSYAYQWQRETAPDTWEDISDEMDNHYTPSFDDEGSALRVEVTATNLDGSTSEVSSATAAVTDDDYRNIPEPGDGLGLAGGQSWERALQRPIGVLS